MAAGTAAGGRHVSSCQDWLPCMPGRRPWGHCRRASFRPLHEFVACIYCSCFAVAARQKLQPPTHRPANHRPTLSTFACAGTPPLTWRLLKLRVATCLWAPLEGWTTSCSAAQPWTSAQVGCGRWRSGQAGWTAGCLHAVRGTPPCCIASPHAVFPDSCICLAVQLGCWHWCWVTLMDCVTSQSSAPCMCCTPTIYLSLPLVCAVEVLVLNEADRPTALASNIFPPHVCLCRCRCLCLCS
jgi:hypothetical protein